MLVSARASAWISHRSTHVPPHLNIPKPFHPTLLPEPQFEFPESHGKFPLAVYFTCGNVCFLVPCSEPLHSCQPRPEVCSQCLISIAALQTGSSKTTDLLKEWPGTLGAEITVTLKSKMTKARNATISNFKLKPYSVLDKQFKRSQENGGCIGETQRIIWLLAGLEVHYMDLILRSPKRARHEMKRYESGTKNKKNKV